MAKRKKVSPIYKAVRAAVRFVYPKMEVVDRQNITESPVIIVSNHAQMNGPIACELYFPNRRYTWCVSNMMNTKEVPSYAYRDFWSKKPAVLRPFYKVLSYIIAPFASFLFNNANTVPVYHDKRIIATFKTTVTLLEEGNDIVIFPEHDVPYNNIVYEFQDKFIDVAKLYYKRTGKEVLFVPMYIAPKLKKMYIGKGIRFCADNPIESERRRICEYLMKEITDTAHSLERHTVIPYSNIPKKFYPKNKEDSQ